MMTVGIFGILLNIFAVCFFIRQRSQRTFHRWVHKGQDILLNIFAICFFIRQRSQRTFLRWVHKVHAILLNIFAVCFFIRQRSQRTFHRWVHKVQTILLNIFSVCFFVRQRSQTHRVHFTGGFIKYRPSCSTFLLSASSSGRGHRLTENISQVGS